MTTPPSPGRRVSPTRESPSEHSSPRPQSELGLPDEHSQRQRDQDAHLAQSMTMSSQPVRNRSSTLLNSDQRTTSAGNGLSLGQQQGEGSREGFHRGVSTGTVQTVQAHGSESRRRPSVSVTPDATDAMGHLADDLEREDREEEGHDDHEEHSYYGREAGMSGNGRGAGGAGGSRSGGIAAGMRSNQTPRSAAAARLYRHHRNLSDSSIDSQGGAYIDHRRQPHSLSSGVTPRGMARSPEANYGSARKASALRRFSLEGGGGASGRSPISARPFDNDTLRASRSPGYPEEAIEDDEDGPRSSDRPYLSRHDSRKSYHSNTSRHSDDHARDDVAFPDLSRPGSGFGKPEDDICFPAHGAAAEMDYMEDHHGEVGMPGVLPNFPYPFDFSILEDFATEERESTGKPIPAARRRGGGGGDRSGADSSTSPPSYGISSSNSKSNPRAGAFSSGSEGEAPRTMGGRRRRLSESVAPGRHRPKVALFEGSGDTGGDAPPPTFRSILDTRTPLLSADKRHPSDAGYGTSRSRPNDRKPTGPRPYRFSFYSNALPSTIHARSLAEIPGEGQTFEELFIGRKENQYEDDLAHVGLDPRLAQFQSATASQSGTSTPNLNGTAASIAGSTTGRAQMGAPAGVPTSRGDKPRTAVMRSDADAESNTWWLDVMCPTDAEMKVLSKVRYSLLLFNFAHTFH